MAIDESLLRSVVLGRGPVLRLYGWSAPVISVGYAQDAGPFAGKGFEVVRRFTGGRAVLHDAEVTYAIAAPVGGAGLGGGINDTYSVISLCILQALRRAGIDASAAPRSTPGAHRNGSCFLSPSRHEIVVAGRKLVGSAQRRLGGAFLQHGSILLRIDREKAESVFGNAAAERMACVEDFCGANENRIRALLIEEFGRGLSADFETTRMSLDEEKDVCALLEKKYSRKEWNLGGKR